jgi:hypothetical protein
MSSVRAPDGSPQRPAVARVNQNFQLAPETTMSATRDMIDSMS